MSSLSAIIRETVASDGPMSLERFMGLANGHPTLGYYAARDPFGAAGDFTTAPEISQMFGELVGVWAAHAWEACGSPMPVHLIELGPGRGTMMADALRALRLAPGFLGALDVHLVEGSPRLSEQQRATLASSPRPVFWHATLDTLPQGPAVILANEFFDALPVRHFARTAGRWHERLVGIDANGAFAWGLSPHAESSLHAVSPDGAILEIGAVAQRVMGVLADRVVRENGALLAIDYGYAQTAFGETLQAVRRHRFVDPLAHPGEADLTAHVDFAALARAARIAGAQVHGPVTQRDFLEQLGIRTRAATLAKSTTPDAARRIGSALNRLTDDLAPTDMGRLFKVLAVTRPGVPPLVGLNNGEPL